MPYKFMLNAMKRMLVLLATLAPLLASAQLPTQTNLLTGYVGNYGVAPQAGITCTLTLLDPNPRTFGQAFINVDPVQVLTDTNGYFAYTNILWGNYSLFIAGQRFNTQYKIQVQTTTTNTVPLVSLGRTATPPWPNPQTNYYTMPQVDSLIRNSTGVQVAAGTNTTAVTNGTVVTISSTASGGSAITNNQVLPGVPVASAAGMTNAAGFAVAGLNDATSAAQNATNGFGTASRSNAAAFDLAGTALAATNGLRTAAYSNASAFDLAGTALASTNGYPWGSLYDPVNAALNATNSNLLRTNGNGSALTGLTPGQSGAQPTNANLTTIAGGGAVTNALNTTGTATAASFTGSAAGMTNAAGFAVAGLNDATSAANGATAALLAAKNIWAQTNQFNRQVMLSNSAIGFLMGLAPQLVGGSGPGIGVIGTNGAPANQLNFLVPGTMAAGAEVVTAGITAQSVTASGFGGPVFSNNGAGLSFDGTGQITLQDAFGDDITLGTGSINIGPLTNLFVQGGSGQFTLNSLTLNTPVYGLGQTNSQPIQAPKFVATGSPGFTGNAAGLTNVFGGITNYTAQVSAGGTNVLIVTNCTSSPEALGTYTYGTVGYVNTTNAASQILYGMDPANDNGTWEITNAVTGPLYYATTVNTLTNGGNWTAINGTIPLAKCRPGLNTNYLNELNFPGPVLRGPVLVDGSFVNGYGNDKNGRTNYAPFATVDGAYFFATNEQVIYVSPMTTSWTNKLSNVSLIGSGRSTIVISNGVAVGNAPFGSNFLARDFVSLAPISTAGSNETFINVEAGSIGAIDGWVLLAGNGSFYNCYGHSGWDSIAVVTAGRYDYDFYNSRFDSIYNGTNATVEGVYINANNGHLRFFGGSIVASNGTAMTAAFTLTATVTNCSIELYGTALWFGSTNGGTVTNWNNSGTGLKVTGFWTENGNFYTSGTNYGNGSGLTNLNASNLASGTVSDARLSANVPLLNGSNYWTGSAASFAGAGTQTNAPKTYGTAQTNSGTIQASAFVGDGSGLTNLNASNLASGTTPTARLGSGSATASTFLRGDQTWAATGGGSATDISTFRQTVAVFDDFIGGEPNTTSAVLGQFGWLGIITGSGATVRDSTSADTNAPGVLTFSTGITSTGDAGIYSWVHSAHILLGAAVYTNEFRIRFQALPISTDSYTNEVGLGNNSTGSSPANGVFMRVSTNNAHFVFVCRSGSSESSVTNTTTVQANKWFKVQLTVNGSGTSATMYVDDGSGGPLGDAVTITTNIPVGSGKQISPMAFIQKDVGTTPVLWDIDYMYLGYTLTISR